MSHYPASTIESKWQKRWEESGLFRTKEKPKRKYYNLVMFAYPSGDLHMGHCKNYVIGDAITRYKRRQGYDVLHPFGWDAFGLPAENAAIQRGIHPKEWTFQNIEISRQGLKRLGISYDWDREVITCLPDYYRWTQWMFLLLYKNGLAYRKEAYVNFCPGCQTVLANEQVEEGRCYRCQTLITKRRLTQWFFKITAYAERLLRDIDRLEGWPESVKIMQRNWIGRSEGCLIKFPIVGDDEELSVFTTRADTIYGVTFMAVAPEHPLIDRISDPKITKFAERVRATPDYLRAGGKDGIKTGLFAQNPLTGERIPIWVTDYVLATYGTGAVMGVPAHDERDYEFARLKGLPIRKVIEGDAEGAYTGEGRMINSGPFTGMDSESGRKAIARKLKEIGMGGATVEYRLRDWLISRQRYWGAPIPMIHCPSCGIVPVPEADLPVLLPEGKIDFLPKGRSPLEACSEFITTTCPKCGGEAKRDPDTMDTFVCSSWYFLRYLDPRNDKEFCAYDRAKDWLPIDQYIGGIEHATGHLIYFRFLTKVLYDQGLIPVDEPALNLFTQGMILKNGEKMSASRGNTVPLNRFLDEHGADVARINILFAAPPENDMEWTDEGVIGAERFLNRVYRLVSENKDRIPAEPSEYQPDSERAKELYIAVNQTIKKVTDDLDRFKFNTAVAAIMELVNRIYLYPEKDDPVFGIAINRVIHLLSPLAPHLADELWSMIGGEGFLIEKGWIGYDPDFLETELRTYVVQINGRLRGKVEARKGADEETIRNLALKDPKVKRFITGKEIVKTIFVPDKLINFVLR
ncbi:leucine--tRNA ligase [candidate division WOR-3 bacterium]|uniref:Leucine--tRNA ligase n=1 Tax=candidate division WOR-3 bacterium TaxID=2052148 RepID=A0A660SGY0_UNCW3|nr:MAG: leucine--tRNA ligase [candidate division WOR-3 bacterium]